MLVWDWIVVLSILAALVILGITCFWPHRKPKPSVARLWTPDGAEAYCIRGVETEAEALEMVGGGARSIKLVPTLDGITTWVVVI